MSRKYKIDGIVQNNAKISRVFEICNAYESGMGHGIQKDGKREPPFTDPELNDAFLIGYSAGVEMADEMAAGEES